MLGCAKQAEILKRELRRFARGESRVRLPGLRANGQHGFSLVELITIMVIVGIVAAVAVPRFFDRGTFDSRRYHDESISTLRYAQKVAIAQHRLVCVAFTANGITLTIDSDVPPDGVCNASPAGDLSDPSGQTPYVVNAPSGVTLSGFVTPMNFDPLGRASAPQDITVSGYPDHIRVDAETGYVR